MSIAETVINRLRVKRGWTDEILAQLENPTVGDLHNPFLLENMSEFIDALHHAKGKSITIIPDYDADGILSGSLLVAALSALDFKQVNLYPPRAQTGYGMTPKSIQEAVGRYPDTEVLITTDNGSNAHLGVNYALKLGLEVLITDHHQADSGDPVPMVVNPNRPTDTYPNKGLSGTAVIWKVMQAYASRYGNKRQQTLVDLLVPLVGMSVISDVMPLLDENRYCVQEAINMLQNPEILRHGASVEGQYGDVFRGLLVLYEICDEHKKFDYGFDESTFGFVFGPMLNAPRRMTGSSKLGFQVFIADTEVEAREAVHELFSTNEERKQLMRKFNQAYLSPIDSSQNPLDYMLGVVPFRSGLIGLIAGQFTNTFNLPAIVFGNPDLKQIHYHGGIPEWVDVVSGSGRSPDWFNLHEALTQMSLEHSEWFVSFGGHKQAAGVGIHAEHYEAFRERFIELVLWRLTALEKETSEIDIDNDPTIWISYQKDVTTQPYDVLLENSRDVGELVDVVDYVNQLKPYGPGFNEPAFGVRFSTADAEVFFMGAEKQHVKFTLPNGLVVIQWNGAETLRKQLAGLNGPFDFKTMGKLSLNEFRDRITVQIIADQLDVENVKN